MRKFAAFALAAVVTAGCKDNPQVNPVDAPSVTALQGALTRTSLQTLATGVLAQDRSATTSTFTFYTLSAIYGRDAYRIDASEPRYVSETLGGNADPSSFAGSGGWSAFYTAIRAANTLQEAIPAAAANQVSAVEKSAALGFIKTIKALDYYRLLELRDTVGVSIQSSDPNVAFTDIKCKPAVINYIAALLDSAQTDLTAAGTTALPFVLPTGFTAFGRNYSTANNILIFNRALKGKVDYYRALNRQAPQAALYPTAIAELTTALGAGPGLVPASQFNTGPYYVFVVGGTEATPNPLSDTRLGMNPIVQDSLQAGDTRASKIVARTTLTAAAPFSNITTSITYFGATSATVNQSRPIGILRDEELVLLRAQAYNETGAFANATADLNSVRAAYGLAPRATIASVAQGRTWILTEKRYSLMFEGPQRMVDLRAYGFLNGTYLRKEATTDPFNSAFPIPVAEKDARSGAIACTA